MCESGDAVHRVALQRESREHRITPMMLTTEVFFLQLNRWILPRFPRHTKTSEVCRRR